MKHLIFQIIQRVFFKYKNQKKNIKKKKMV